MARYAGLVFELARGGLIRRNRRIGPHQSDSHTPTRRVVQAVAVGAGDIVLLVSACRPESEMPVAFVTSETDFSLLRGRHRFVAETDDAADAAPATGFHVRRGVAMAGLAVWPLEVARLAMLGGKIAFNPVGVAGLARLRLRRDRPLRGSRPMGACEST